MSIDIKEVKHGTWELSFSTGAAMSAVFDYVIDFERHVEWEEQLLEVKRLGRKARESGAKYLKTYGTRPTGIMGRLFWTPTRIDCKIKVVDRPHRIAWEQQLWRDQTSESFYYQDVELLLSSAGRGCEARFVRRLMSDDAVTADFAMGAHNLMSSLFRQIPPEMKDKLTEQHKLRYPGRAVPNALEMTSGEVAGQLLEGLPIRGPGSRSLTRLKAVLDAQGS
jgi:hypothetical protein